MPQLTLNKMLGALRFKSKGLRMPRDYDFVTPSLRDTYMRSLAPRARIGVPQLIPPWFDPHLRVKPHQDMCDTLGQFYKDMHDIMCDAVVFGHNMWRLQAKFAPMPIAAAVVAGPPGCLTGPPLEGLIKQFPRCASMTPKQAPYRDAVAKGLSKAFQMWQVGVTVPGLPFYPSYVMQPPGPAIPTPNVPQKLIACVSPNIASLLVPNVMKELMCVAFDPTMKIVDADDAFFESISTVFSLGFLQWMSNQMVLGVVGSGAVASPVGGPVAGVTMPTPGHFVA